jgi:hypothetical protein
MTDETASHRPVSPSSTTGWSDIKAPSAPDAPAGEVIFLDVALEVGPGVVTPRMETAVLVREVLDRLVADTGIRHVVDMCCGCGAIALALA